MTPAKDLIDRNEHTDHAALTPTLQWISNLMRLSALCSRPKCNRAQRCRGEPRDCLMRYAPLVPEEAREGAKAMVDGAMRRLAFDELRDEAPEVDDLIAWRDLVDSCAARARAAR